MSPLQIAAASAVLVTLVASFLPADRVRDRQARSWVPKSWLRYRAKLLVLQLVATAVLATGAVQIGWSPEPKENLFSALAQGTAWSVAAAALLRAEFAGFRAQEATPGFSLLRSLSKHLTDDLNDDICEAVRSSLPTTVDGMRKCAFKCKSRAYPHRPDGTQTPDAKALAAAIVELAEQNPLSDLGEMIVDTVIQHHLPRCW